MSRTTMRASVIAVILTLAAFGSAAQAAGTVNFIIGQKMLDEHDWAPFDKQTEFGALMSFGSEEWPVQIAVDVIASSDDMSVWDPEIGFSFDLTGSTLEVDLGVRKIWERNRMRPFLGGGLALIEGEIEASVQDLTISTDDNGVGVWIDGGIFWRLGERFNIGFEARISTAETEPTIEGESFDVEAGGEHIGLLLGWSW